MFYLYSVKPSKYFIYVISWSQHQPWCDIGPLFLSRFSLILTFSTGSSLYLLAASGIQESSDSQGLSLSTPTWEYTCPSAWVAVSSLETDRLRTVSLFSHLHSLLNVFEISSASVFVCPWVLMLFKLFYCHYNGILGGTCDHSFFKWTFSFTSPPAFDNLNSNCFSEEKHPNRRAILMSTMSNWKEI